MFSYLKIYVFLSIYHLKAKSVTNSSLEGKRNDSDIGEDKSSCDECSDTFETKNYLNIFG